MKLVSGKSVVALFVGGVLAAAAVGAYAFWTTSGNGSSSAANASANGTVTLHANWTAGALFPGGSQVVHFTADNTGSSDLFVGTVSSVVSTSDPGCLPADFTIAPVIENQVVPHGSTGVALANNGLITFANTGVNQDLCKGATVTLTLSST